MAVFQWRAVLSPTSTGNVAYTGVGFEPKAVLFFTTYASAIRSSPPDAYIGVGAMTANEQFWAGMADETGSGTMDMQRHHRTAAVALCTEAGADVLIATRVSLDSDGFTLNWSTVNGTGRLIMALCIGGSDVEADIREVQLATATGNQAVTGVGFEPTVIFHYGAYSTSASPHSTNNMSLQFGVCDENLNQWGFGTWGDDGDASSQITTCQSDNHILSRPENDAVNRVAAIGSLDSDGFTINHTTVTAFADRGFFLCLTGVKSFAGTATATTTGNQVISGVGFQAGAVLLGSILNNVADNTALTSGKQELSIGGFDGTTELAMVYSATDNSGASDGSVQYTDTYALYSDRDLLRATPSIGSPGSDGFTVSWAISGGWTTDRKWHHLSLGSYNTAPTLSIQPTASYATRTRTGPVNTWGYSFRAQDTEQTGADALSYEVRTSATPGGGSLIDSGTCTSGVTKTVTGEPYNTAGLAQGSNTLYVHVDDGVGGTVVSSSFTLLRDDSVAAPNIDVPTSPLIQEPGDNTYNIVFDAPDTYSTGTNEMTLEIRTASGGGGSLLNSYSFTQNNNLALSPYTDSTLAPGTNTRYLRIIDGAANAAEASYTVILQELKEPVDEAAINVTEDVSLEQQLSLDVADDAAINVTEVISLEQQQNVDVADDAAINVDETIAIAADLEVADDAAVNVDEALAIEAQLDLVDDAAINVTETISIEVFGNFTPRRLRAEIYDVDGETRLGDGPLRTILGAETDQTLGEIGSYNLMLPANEPNIALLTDGREIWLFREGEGLVFKGVVERALWRAGDAATVTVSGNSVAKTLYWDNTQMNLKFSLEETETVLDALLTDTDFTAGTVVGGLNDISIEYDGVSKWLAAKRLAEYLGVHIREDVINKELDLGPFGDNCGILLRSVRKSTPALEETPLVYPITAITRLRDSAELWNRVQPFGAGEGSNRLDLRYSTRVSPYTIQSGTVNGETQYWLENASSITSYRRRTKVISFKDIGPQENTQAAFVEASNTLYDATADFLDRSSDPLDEYTVDVTGIKQYDGITGAPYFQLGDKFHVFYRGLDSEGVWLDVDAELFVLGIKRRYSANGECVTSLKVSSVDKLVADDARIVAGVISDVRSMQLSHRPFNYREIHGPYRQTVNDTYPMEFAFRFDGNVAYLLKSRLEFRIKPLRSNTSGSASGGSTSPSTSAGGSSSPSSSSGGGSSPTTAGGASHSHTFSGGSTGSDTSSGLSFQGHNSSSPNYPGSDDNNVGHTHAHGDPTTGANSVAHHHDNVGHSAFNTLYEFADAGHAHSVSGGTSGSESSHTHSVTISAHSHTVTIDAHTHSVTIDAHSHALSYGVYEQAASASPGIMISINGVDRTGALSGPWNADTDVDITEYLLDDHQQPLRQQHVILLSVASGKLIDLDVTLRSMVTANSVGAV